jgi:hypothetical protein
MRIGKILSFVVAVVMFLFCAVRPAQAQWHAWPQWQRYGATVNMALCQNGFKTGMPAKTWVKFVVYAASSGAMTLPETKPNMFEWYPNPYVFRFPTLYPPSSWQPGQIIQMKWGHRPHTAIFICNYTSKEKNGMYWIDCNWGHTGTVEYRFVSYADFARKVGAHYSVYEVH